MAGRIVLLVGLALVAALAPAPPAAACSCGMATVEEMVERDPDVAVAVVRRIDRDGGPHGVGVVERTLRGSLPERLALELDDGSSCKPWLGAGQLAALAFEHDGSTWRTFDCSQLDEASTFASAYGDIGADPPGTKDPAVLLAGSMPGAGLALLDADLEVLATALAPPGPAVVEPCGDAVLTIGSDGEERVVTRLSLPDLRVTGEHRLDADSWQERLLDVACDGEGRVRALTATGEGPAATLALYDDLLGRDVRELPPAAGAAFAGDGVVLARSDHDTTVTELEAHDLSTGEVTALARFEGMVAHELTVAPGGRHLTVRGFADEPVLLVVDRATGETVARSPGWWMPVSQPWLDADRLLLRDEDRGLNAPPGPAGRIVDVYLEDSDGSPGVPRLDNTDVVAADGHVMGVGGAELTVLTPGGALRASADPRTAAARGAVLLGPVSPDAGVDGSPDAGVDDSPDARPEPAAERTALPLLLPGLLLLAGLLLAGRRRDRQRPAATSWRTRSRGSRRRRGR